MTVHAPVLSTTRAPRRIGFAIKRSFDVLTAAALVLVLAPVLIVLALAVRLSSPGPALYRQVRVGERGKRFTVLKFRSMHVGADQQLDQLAELNEASGPLFKIRHDPRLTRLGRWMRRFSLDELPQLLNVLGGSMSLVGPRPALPEEVDCFDAAERRRHLVKPGLTGLAQVSGRSDLPWEESVELDLHYVDHWSPILDLVILARTLPAVLGSRGAY